MRPISLHSLPPAFEIFQGVAGFCKARNPVSLKRGAQPRQGVPSWGLQAAWNVRTPACFLKAPETSVSFGRLRGVRQEALGGQRGFLCVSNFTLPETAGGRARERWRANRFAAASPSPDPEPVRPASSADSGGGSGAEAERAGTQRGPVLPEGGAGPGRTPWRARAGSRAGSTEARPSPPRGARTRPAPRLRPPSRGAWLAVRPPALQTEQVSRRACEISPTASRTRARSARVRGHARSAGPQKLRAAGRGP